MRQQDLQIFQKIVLLVSILGEKILIISSASFKRNLYQPKSKRPPEQFSGSLNLEKIIEKINYFFFFCGGKSVHTPNDTSAAIPIDSPSVG